MIKAIFIDIDNTLLDFDGYVKEAMENGFRQFGLTPYQDDMFPVFQRINNKLWHEIEANKLTLKELQETRWNRIFDILGIVFDGRRFETYFKDGLFHSAIPIPGAIESLTYLQENYLLCAASNGPYKQQCNRLKKAGMEPFFTHLFISEKIGASKPSKAFFAYSINKLNESLKGLGKESIRPSEIMIIGDSLTSDVEGGRQNGLKTCLFDRTRNPREKNAADYIIGDLNEIKTIL